MKKFWPLAIFSLIVIVLARGLSLDPHQLPSTKVGYKLPAFYLKELETQQTISNKKLPHDIILLNFWASWCSSCADEQVFLLQLAQHGIKIFGVNYKDSYASAHSWLKKWGDPFVKVISDSTGSLGMDLGVYGTPETFLIDSSGNVQYRFAGVLTPKVWQQEFKPRLKKLGWQP